MFYTQLPSAHLNGLFNVGQLDSPAHSAMFLEQNPFGHNNGLVIGQPNSLVLLFNLQYPSADLVILLIQAFNDLSN